MDEVHMFSCPCSFDVLPDQVCVLLSPGLAYIFIYAIDGFILFFDAFQYLFGIGPCFEVFL